MEPDWCEMDVVPVVGIDSVGDPDTENDTEEEMVDDVVVANVSDCVMGWDAVSDFVWLSVSGTELEADSVAEADASIVLESVTVGCVCVDDAMRLSDIVSDVVADPLADLELEDENDTDGVLVPDTVLLDDTVAESDATIESVADLEVEMVLEGDSDVESVTATVLVWEEETDVVEEADWVDVEDAL